MARMRKGRGLTVQPDCLKDCAVCGTVYGDMHLKISWDLSKEKSIVSYPGLGFLSSATWPPMPKKSTTMD